MVSQLYLVCGSLGTRPPYSLVVEEDVKKAKQTKKKRKLRLRTSAEPAQI